MYASEANDRFTVYARAFGVSLPYVFVDGTDIVLAEVFANIDSLLAAIIRDSPETDSGGIGVKSFKKKVDLCL